MALCFDPNKRLAESRTYEADVQHGRRIAADGLCKAENQDLHEAMKYATDLCGYFCLANSLPLAATVNRRLKLGTLGHCVATGDKETFLVAVDLEQAERNRDPRDSSSVLGVLAHEVGHMAHGRLGFGSSMRLDRILRCEDPINDYEAVYRGRGNFVSETMAESIREFIVNPLRLRDGWPRRWEMLASRLKPIFELPPAPPRPEDWNLGDEVYASCYNGVVTLWIKNQDLEIALPPEVMEKLNAYSEYVNSFPTRGDA